jgi:tryptophan synthase alpha chain
VSERERAGPTSDRGGARLARTFAELRARGEAALIVYLTAGDPHIDETPGLVCACAAAGADVVELGVPFSDPSADGPVIQRAMERALATGGMARGAVDRTLAAVAAARRDTDVPVVLFGYFNPLLQRGLQRTVADARAAGVDGLLVVDLPPEESSELDGALGAAGVARVPLVAPTTPEERARRIAAGPAVTGFVYYVALTGVTGAGHLDAADVAARTAALRPALGGLPLAVGFGVRRPADARAVAAAADGVVVGSALVQAIAEGADAADRRARAAQLVRALKGAIASPGARTAG